VILHLGMFIRMHAHSVIVMTASNFMLRSATVNVINVASSAYHLLDSDRLLEVSSVYPLFKDLSHRISGSTIRIKSNGDRRSP